MSRRVQVGGRCALTGLLLAAAACGPGVQVGPALPDPGGALDAARRSTGPDRPHFLRFRWDYADDRGSVKGEGAARYNPGDSLRVDLFSTGDVSLRVALVDGELHSAGRIEGVELPSAAFMYAMAGLFRPRSSGPEEARETNRGKLFRYDLEGGGVRSYLVRRGRVVRVEDRKGGGVWRRVEVKWDSAAAWPTSAEYRNFRTPRRVRWQLERSRAVKRPFEPEIYDLPETAPAERAGREPRRSGG